jgi:hypothetical protein
MEGVWSGRLETVGHLFRSELKGESVPPSFGRFAVLVLVVGALLAPSRYARAERIEPVLFVAPAVGDLDAALRDALYAQLSGASTQLLFERFSPEASTLRRQVAEARTLAAARHAIGVFWLDAPVDKDWLLYLAEPGGDRVLVRRVAVEADGAAAATEAVAVITAESSVALARGQTIGMQPVALPPEEPPRAVPPKAPTAPPSRAAVPSPERHRSTRFFVGFGYYGDGPTQEIRWQSGARLSLGARFVNGFYLNAGYLFFKQTTVRGSDLTFQVSRNPLDLGVGFALRRNRWAPALELRAIGEILTRENVATSSGLQATPNATRVLMFVSPRARLDWALSEAAGVYAAAGIDIAINSFSFVSRIDDQYRPLLRPAPVRPAFELGASFSL